MLDRLKSVRDQALKQLEQVADADALRQLESETVGKKGAITTALRTVGELPPGERPAVGKLANEIRQELEAAIAAREELIEAQALAQSLEQGAVDVTLPGRPVTVGRLHPATQMLRQVYAI